MNTSAASLDEKSIFNIARHLEPGELRDQYLQQACGDNPEALRRLGDLLRAYDQEQSFLESPATAILGNSAATTEHALEKVGMQIGPYKLLQQIGQGGMGVVYMAEQTVPISRRVALKIIKPGMDTRQVIARFEAERQALSLMDHPNIAKVLDAGTTESGRPFFVMELVKGQPITQYCDDHQLTLRQRLELLLPVCQAIQHAHQKGIIHRDIKPTNILVAEYDQQPAPKVIDFGVAKATSQSLTEKTMFTGLGQIVGTLEYMSPEQAKVNQLDIDTRSDIYSLGVLLYELLTGSTPFDKQRLRSAGWDEMLRIIREEEPPKPSTKLSSGEGLPSVAANRGMEPARLSRSVRGELDWIVMKALEKDRNRRYETANGLAMDLHRFLADEPVLACPPSRRYQLQKFVQRNKTGVAVAALVLFFVVLLGSSIGWAVRDRAATAQQIAAQRAARQARLEQKLAELLEETELHYRNGQPSAALATVRQAEVVLAEGGASPKFAERVRRWRRDLEMVAGLEKIRLERATLADDGKWDWSGADRAYQQAFSNYGLNVEAGEAADLAERIRSSRIAVELAVALDDWVDVRRRLPNTDESAWRDLIAAAQAADPDPLRNQLRSLWGRKVEEIKGDIEQLAASLPGQKLQPTTVVLVARVLKLAALNAEVETVLREGQERYPGDFWINFELAYHLATQPWAKLVDAPGFYRAAVAVRPGNALVHSNLGFALARLSRPAEAERAHREAIRLSPNYSRAHVGLGTLYRSQGQWPEAIAAFEEAARLDPADTLPRAELVKLYTNCPELSLRDYRRALDLGSNAAQLAPNSTWELQNLGWAQYRLGQWQEAIASLEKSCQLQGNVAQGDAFQWFFLAMANQQLGRKDEARRWYDKCFEHTDYWDEESRRMQAEAADLLGIASPPDKFFESLAEGRKQHGAKSWQAAIDAYSQAIELAPIQAAATWRNRGQSYLELEQWEPAIQDLTRSIEIVPEQNWVLHLRGRAWAGLGKPEQAIADFTADLQLNPRDWGALGHRGSAHRKLLKLDEAAADFTAALEGEPHRAWLWQGRGWVHILREAWQQALSDFQRAVRCEPESPTMWREYFNCCAKAGQWEEAAAECDRALTALPATSNPWRQSSGLTDIAAERDEIYERLCKLRPADRTLRIARARVLRRRGDGQQAGAVLAEVTHLDPSDHWSWYLQAIVHLEAGAVEEYRRVCREMLARFAQSPDPFVAERVASACLLAAGAVEDLSAARQLAERAATVHPGNRWFRLAQALGDYRAGEFEQAMERLQGCLESAKEAPGLAESAWLVRSMAEHRLERTAEARNSFAKAQELIDQRPASDVSPLSDAWVEHRRFLLLYQETEESLALGSGAGQAFVVGAGDPTVERRFFTLAAAVASSQDGDTIEIRGNGPFFSRPLAIGSRRLTIRAAAGFRPVIQFGANSNANQGVLLAATAPLVLEGLELRDGGLAEPAPRYAALIFSHQASLYVANCRFLVKGQRAINHYAGSVCQVRNCEFLGKPLLGFRCDSGQRIVLDNNVLPWSADVPIIGVWPPCKDISVRLTRNCLQGNAAIQFSIFQKPLRAAGSEQGQAVPLQIESAGNIFDIYHFGTQFGFDLADGISPEQAKAGLLQYVAWKQQGDLFALRTAPAGKIRANQASGERIDVAKLTSLEDWTQYWGQAAGSVIGGTVKYQGGDLPRRATSAPEQLTPDDFRLTADSAGYRAGPDGKDLGPDLDLVGPGPGYERWKQTAEYQQWLIDSGQRMTAEPAP